MKSRRLIVRCDESTLHMAKQLAEKNNTTLSAYVRDLIVGEYSKHGERKRRLVDNFVRPQK